MARWAYGWGLLASSAAGAALVAGACLPDLAPNLCGNGYIDPGETCDPGVNITAGCSSGCQVVCAESPSEGKRYFFDSPFSDHCYFTSKKVETFDNAVYSCQQQGSAHVVTFVDDDEVGSVSKHLSSLWPEGARYWVGFDRTVGGGPYTAESNNEPGWNSPANCSGCFLHGVTGSVLPVADGGAEAGAPECVVAASVLASTNTMEVIGRNATAEVVCEREPVGSRSVPCFDGSFCFNVLATTKGYVYSPVALPPDAAEAHCRALTDAGTASLVVFASRAEREQVIYELSQLRLLNGGGDIPNQFWIGLSAPAPAPADGGASGGLDAGVTDPWVWDDGVRAATSPTVSHPSVWGNHQPATSVSARAYINIQNGYDTGLAYAESDNPSSPQAYPFVCQH
jgi:hypothetical protein